MHTKLIILLLFIIITSAGHGVTGQTYHIGGSDDDLVNLVVNDFAGGNRFSKLLSYYDITSTSRFLDSSHLGLDTELPFVTKMNRVVDQHARSELERRVRPVMLFYRREGAVEFILFRDSRPIIYSKPGRAIIISTGLLNVAGSDQALNGVIAHELMHEYYGQESYAASQRNDTEKLREIELSCDAAATLTMISLGFDPAAYADVLKRMYGNSEISRIMKVEVTPKLENRLRIIYHIKRLAFDMAIGRAKSRP